VTTKPADREVRDDLVGHYQAYARSRGSNPTTSDLESLAVADLVLTDRVQSETHPRSRVIATPDPVREGPSPAAQIAADRGFRFEKRGLPLVDAAPRAPKKPLQAIVGERYTALIKRMRQMCQSAPSLKARSLADREYLYPAFAKGVIQEHTDYTFGRRKYRGLNHKDRQKAFWRSIEDLADRSTGVLGPWWVK
jgi:hypothetical protein